LGVGFGLSRVQSRAALRVAAPVPVPVC
jgi:hypothetical protein